MPVRRPELQFRITFDAEPEMQPFLARKDADAIDDLCVAAIETLRDPDNRAQYANRVTPLA